MADPSRIAYGQSMLRASLNLLASGRSLITKLLLRLSVATVDLFPGFAPFTAVRVLTATAAMPPCSELSQESGLDLVFGYRDELAGFKTFELLRVLKDLGRTYVRGTEFDAMC